MRKRAMQSGSGSVGSVRCACPILLLHTELRGWLSSFPVIAVLSLPTHPLVRPLHPQHQLSKARTSYWPLATLFPLELSLCRLQCPSVSHP